MMERGRFAVIEGIDASGKGTQVELLVEKAKSLGMDVETADFPRYYDSIWGEIIGELLHGEHGDFIGVTPYLTIFPYMIDQYTWSRDIGKDLINNGKMLFSNRYFTSNVHQISKLEGKDKEIFRERVWKIGYEKLGLLKPDAVLFLDVPPEYSEKLNLMKKDRNYLSGEKQDQAEADRKHQRLAYEEYLYMVKTEESWHKIQCMKEEGVEIEDKMIISNRVWQKFQEIGFFED